MSGSCRFFDRRTFLVLLASAALGACGSLQPVADGLEEHCSHDRLQVTSNQVYAPDPGSLCDREGGTCDSLAQAFNTAAVCENAQTIVLSDGAHYTFSKPVPPYPAFESRNRQARIRSGASALPVIANAVVVEGNGATFERAAPATNEIRAFESPFRFFYVDTEGSLTLRNMTLSNGLIYLLVDQSMAGPTGGYQVSGGAILNLGELQLWDTTLTGNRVARPSRYNDDGLFYGIHDGNAIFNAGRLHMSGGPLDRNASPVSSRDDLSTFVVNNKGDAQFENIVVIPSRFDPAGGMLNNPDGTLTLHRSSLGRGIPLINHGQMQVFESLLRGVVATDAGDTLIRNSTIDRAATGIRCRPAGGTASVTLDSVTIFGSGVFEDDSPNVGIGIELYSSCLAQFRNTVVAGSQNVDCRISRDSRVSGTRQNLDSDGSCLDFMTAAAKLGELQDNGGPSHTRMPAADSPLVDAGDSICPSHDQRGQRRSDGACDIGAVER